MFIRCLARLDRPLSRDGSVSGGTQICADLRRSSQMKPWVESPARRGCPLHPQSHSFLELLRDVTWRDEASRAAYLRRSAQICADLRRPRHEAVPTGRLVKPCSTGTRTHLYEFTTRTTFGSAGPKCSSKPSGMRVRRR